VKLFHTFLAGGSLRLMQDMEGIKKQERKKERKKEARVVSIQRNR